MNNKKRILAFLAAACIMASGTAMAEYDPNKVIDTSVPYTTLSETDETLAIEEVPSEEATESEVAPITNFAKIDGIQVEEVDGITMIPLRQVAESLGYTVNWNGETRSVEIIRGAQYITITLDKDEYTFSRRAPEQLGVAPTLVGDSTYVPLSFVDQIIGGYYNMNEDGSYKIVQPAVVTVIEISEEGTVTVDDAQLGAVVLNISDETPIVKGMDRRIYKIDDLAVGMSLQVEYSDAMTMSLPPQNAPVKVIIASEFAQDEISEETEEEITIGGIEVSGTITEIEEELVTVSYGEGQEIVLVVSDETAITKGLDRRIYKIDDLEVGMSITAVHSEATTMSLPPQSAAFSIAIANTAE